MFGDIAENLPMGKPKFIIKGEVGMFFINKYSNIFHCWVIAVVTLVSERPS